MTRSIVCVLAAAAIAALALSPGLDARADASFAWHMVQHLLLLFAVPFFVLASAPYQLFARVAPKRVIVGAARMSRKLEPLWHPAVALPLFIAVLWLTHFSGLYEYALEHEWAHVCEHALFIMAGLAFWTPVLAPPPTKPLPYPLRILFLIVALPQGALLSLALGSAHRVLYAHYATMPNALTDQNNAAAIMWIAGGVVVFCAFLGTFGAWALRESRAADPIAGGSA
jgi:putative membrane protein